MCHQNSSCGYGRGWRFKGNPDLIELRSSSVSRLEALLPHSARCPRDPIDLFARTTNAAMSTSFTTVSASPHDSSIHRVTSARPVRAAQKIVCPVQLEARASILTLSL
jgi:hypothetical protein